MTDDGFPGQTGQRPDGTVFTDAGEGHPVVLIHGIGLRLDIWEAQVAELRKAFRVICYDLYGHGRTPEVAGECSLALYSAQLRALLDGLKIDRAAIVGFSLGGLIGIDFTLREPERVSSLAVLHCAFRRARSERDLIMSRVRTAEKNGPGSVVGLALDRWFTPAFAKRHPETLARVAQWMRANAHRPYADAYHLVAMGDLEVADELHRIACPALVMTGADDRGNSPGMAMRMAELMQDGRCVILPGLRHMALMEDPPAVTAPLERFLRDVADGERMPRAAAANRASS
ncbi:MAG: alpha/beta fold hydrolase [Pseudorhodoplanes sp.]